LPGTDVLVVAAGNTTGWRTAASELVRSIAAAGARVEIVGVDRSPRVRTFALTDFVEARAARRAALRGIAEHDPAAIIYCSITAALLWPRPGAIWLDAVAAENRPGRHGIWQRVVERRRLDQAPMLLTMSPGALGPLTSAKSPVDVPVPVDASGAPGPSRDIAAITYAGDPEKKRLDHVLRTWDQVRSEGETLVVAGLDRLEPRPGVEVAGRLDPAEYRALLRRARVFVAAPRREDYGIAPLEALADGCQLATTPAPGAYPALEIARRLDARLVDSDIARAVRIALDDPSPGYAERAAELLEPFSRRAVDRTVAERVLPRLLPA
jgi:glycosyltransferase involved in cell wall biosynthesis